MKVLRYILSPAGIITLILALFTRPASASHIVGGEVTYQYLGTTTGGYKYQVNLTIYENCVDPLPGVIAGDNPAFFSLYYASPPYERLRNDTVSFASSEIVPANFSNSCITDAPPVCLIKKTFIFDYVLPPSAKGYLFSYQRCCRNATISNILDPGNTGSTYYCVIPAPPDTNNSAVFTHYPPQIICLNTPLYYDNSATDADHDSLSYEFCNCLIDTTNPNFGFSEPPPYDSVTWVFPYSPQSPMPGYPPIQIDPVSGLITGTPSLQGRYLLTVCCHEWRNGRMINTVKREFQFLVYPCSRTTVACIPQFSTDINTYIVDCKDFTVNFINCSTGGTTWHWDFGVPGAVGDTSNQFQPSFTYPDTGTYTVKLIVNPGSSCEDSIERLVKIYPIFKADFSEIGRQCPGDTINFTDLTQSTMKPITYWLWYFGDGDSSFLENPVHMYPGGGIYYVTLIAQNIKDCIDTTFKQLVVEDFIPFAGNDTLIVKGEKIQFDATGGIEYTWSPPINLNDSTINNPVGYYPDTGTFVYDVHVKSAFGCYGDALIKVIVVGQAEFFVPTAFTPNSDGKNDYFKPMLIGYKNIDFFKIFNRWGEEVYSSQDLETGWDGNFNNHLCDIGTYFWEISYMDRFGKKGFVKGDVTLIR